MGKLGVVVLLAGIVAGAALAETKKESGTQPNIVVVLADDLGYGDLGIQGATDVQTPNIDKLFRNGMQFKEAYVSYPACGPSRASIMTGRHHLRFGFPSNPDHIIPTQPGNLLGLPKDEITLAQMLRKQGYATGMFGKWHLGFQQENHPLNRGFDEFYGFLGSLYRYFDLGNMKLPKCMERGFDYVHEKEYLTDAFARESASFIERHKAGPFFLYVPFSAAHTPLMHDKDPGPNAPVPLDGTDDVAENRRMLVNMIEGLDRGVGTIMRKLEECGLEENTLVFFLSDNGGPEATGAYGNGALRGFKGSVFEGGMRVPMAAYWPGKIKPGGSYGHPVLATDIFATAVETAGGMLPGDRTYDSKNLMPVLTGTMQEPLHGNEDLCWDALGMQAVRKGDWKLVMRNHKVVGLYNIPADTGEKNNLADAYPERVAQFEQAHAEWSKGLPPWQFKWVGPEKFAEWEKEHGKQW
ncbi:MAG: sulfatase-like hydrolase/transferase [Kiritimatiellales bacterium]|nr:sulfatase-like hydrolase/transferase [Kiritimatiellales bacterium]MCF7863656.1 sulfatase-like hydrolase/transferase [Kiritimatiellales bacterium]